MHLSSLHLTQFKNYARLDHVFASHLNLIVGPNGTGKTNVLDAIYFLCNTKSAFLPFDLSAIMHEKDFFRVEGHFVEKDKQVKVECVCQKEQAKVFLVDGKSPERLSGYIGRFPVVLVSPYDTDLIREGSETRRKFFDLVLSQANAEYLEKLLVYNRLLKQRNALLKQMAEAGKLNVSLLSVYDDQMLPLNQYISNERNLFVKSFFSSFQKAYGQLAVAAEEPQLQYRSECVNEDFSFRFLRNHQQDLKAQRTLLGIHSDDYDFLLNGSAVKRFASQGQQKTFVLALKLAHFHFVSNIRKKKPLLLLDDIFDRLDENRVFNLAQLVNAGTFGQVFITDSTPKRIASLFASENKEIATFNTI